MGEGVSASLTRSLGFSFDRTDGKEEWLTPPLDRKAARTVRSGPVLADKAALGHGAIPLQHKRQRARFTVGWSRVA